LKSIDVHNTVLNQDYKYLVL